MLWLRIKVDPSWSHTDRFGQEYFKSQWNLETLFEIRMPADCCDNFQPTFCTLRKETIKNHRRKSETFRSGILLPSSSIFEVFLLDTVILLYFSDRFQQNPLVSGVENHRPGAVLLSYRSCTEPQIEGDNHREHEEMPGFIQTNKFIYR